MNKIIEVVARICSLPIKQVAGTVSLLVDGATVPFISRYRKEATGGLDEVQVNAIKETFEKISELQKRKESILGTIEQQGKLTDELRSRISECFDGPQLEDIYLPYKPKRRTRAVVAREKGLEPLAVIIMQQKGNSPQLAARSFINESVPTEDEAIAGASDIIAEWVSESEQSRNMMRKMFERDGVISSCVVKSKEVEGVKYSDYYEMDTSMRRVPSHRLLAMVRGEKEGFLRLSISPDNDKAIESLERLFVKGNSPNSKVVAAAVNDSYKRLLKPSIESEMMSKAKERADKEAIAVFANNLRQLLLMPPLGRKRVLAVDPGFRTGCKLVCLDAYGALLHNETIYPHPPQNQDKEAISKLYSLIETYKIEAIAIGDGTAGRETESLVKRMTFRTDIEVFMVSEDGASVYSASPVAREEFPEYDVTVRGSISIGRRLIDPLSELVKIDPKAIGVGQYQHDVDQSELKRELDTVVQSCVNGVGVNLNTASKHLLAYVSGLGSSLAASIVEYRAANGEFRSRKELSKVPRLGAKTFEQCAGFLRIVGGKNPLDGSAVHPESYAVVEKMASDMGVTTPQLLAQKELRQRVDISRYVTEKVGLPTLTDIMAELEKPGLDPRGKIESFEFANVHKIEDLSQGMILPGIVTNITAFGAFVDVGVKQDGLIHISQLADKFVSAPSDVVKLHQKVTVRVTEIDMTRKRIGLSMKGL